MNFKRKKIGSYEDRKLGSWGKEESSAAEMGWARGREDMEGLERQYLIKNIIACYQRPI
jgi:hypothetical protein